MLYDVTGIVICPGNFGKDCLGNGEHYDKNGELIPICCDECDYQLCCVIENLNCEQCEESACPRKYNKK